VELHYLHASPNVVRVIKFKEDAMSEACIMHKRDEKYIQSFGLKTSSEETTQKTKA
jgi:hypothetical protein